MFVCAVLHLDKDIMKTCLRTFTLAPNAWQYHDTVIVNRWQCMSAKSQGCTTVSERGLLWVQAIEFVQMQRDDELWELLVTLSLESPALTGILLLLYSSKTLNELLRSSPQLLLPCLQGITYNAVWLD